MSKLIIANWKMNPVSVKEAKQLAKESDYSGLIIAPPFPFLEVVSKSIKRSRLAAQDCFWENPSTGRPPVYGGAYTGEVSLAQLKNFDVEYVILGHSERRQNLGETDEMIAKKVAAAAKFNLIPILCVGETKTERESGKTREIIKRELDTDLSLIFKIQNLTPNISIIIAYEPVWAIGTGISDTPENTIEISNFIRNLLKLKIPNLKLRVIYGGSITSKNAEKFLKHKEIEGALVGRTSLNPKEIKEIAGICP